MIRRFWASLGSLKLDFKMPFLAIIGPVTWQVVDSIGRTGRSNFRPIENEQILTLVYEIISMSHFNP